MLNELGKIRELEKRIAELEAELATAQTEFVEAMKIVQGLVNLTGSVRDILGMYLEPGDTRVQTESECVNAILEEMDSDRHIEMRAGVKALLADKAKEGSDANTG